MKRRQFITLLGGAAAAWPLAARAQQRERMRRIGIVMPFAKGDSEGEARIRALKQELAKLGWTDGGNIQFDERWPAVTWTWYGARRQVWWRPIPTSSSPRAAGSSP